MFPPQPMLSRRDEFAKEAMKMLLARPRLHGETILGYLSGCAEDARFVADALIAELDKPQEPRS